MLSTFENAVQKNLELKQVNERLLAIQEELKHNNQQLELANRQKDRFLGMAVHDLRNPLGHITYISELLLDEITERLNDDELDFFTNIHDSSQFMVHLINDLLDVLPDHIMTGGPEGGIHCFAGLDTQKDLMCHGIGCIEIMAIVCRNQGQ